MKTRTSRISKLPATCCASASRSGLSIGCSKGQTRILICTCCPSAAPRLTVFLFSVTGCAGMPEIAICTRTKLDLAQQEWEDIQNYADAKTAVIEEILARAQE